MNIKEVTDKLMHMRAEADELENMLAAEEFTSGHVFGLKGSLEGALGEILMSGMDAGTITVTFDKPESEVQP